jgi:hypothetical protein
MLPVPLRPLAAYRQFILWRLADGTKLPVSPRDGTVCDAHDASHWVSYDEAQQYQRLHNATGVAFVITQAAGFWFLDIDKCLTPAGTWSPLALHLCERLHGAAVEVSQSGKGLHLFGRGTVPPHGCKNVSLGIELYTDRRFVALTGINAIGNVTHDASAQIASVVAQFFPTDGEVGGPGEANWQDVASPDWSGPADDGELLTRALSARQSAAQIVGGRATFSALWYGDKAVLGAAFPDPNGRPYDASSADAALAQHLAFWTGRNTERMRRLMLLSALKRDKWDQHRSYLWRTIHKACSRQPKVLAAKPERQAAPPPTPMQEVPQRAGGDELVGRIKVGSQFMTLQQQLEYFRDCVYISDQHRVVTPMGILKPESFKVMYGGFEFALDGQNDKVGKDAWEAFSNNRGVEFPKVDGACFRPEAGEYNIVREEGRRLINVYRAIHTERSDGDVTPFLAHMTKILPVERDREILLGYMASVIQNPGKKLQWWPVIQGTEGNGKSVIARVMEHCVGKLYSHTPKADQLADSGMKFNSWLANKLLLIIEEIRVGDRVELLDAMKDLVTNDRLEIQGKGRDQVTGDNRANGIMFTNYRDAITGANPDKRRYCIFYTAQQSRDDLERDGMGENYFPRLYDWLRGGGYAAVNGYLRQYVVPEWMRNAVMTRPPETSSTRDSYRESQGPIEQEIQNAIDSGRVGFMGNWISGYWLDQLLREIGRARAVSHQRRTQILQSMGYVPHPNLPEGRVTNPLPADGNSRARIFVRKGTLQAQLKQPSEIASRYLKDQGMGVIAYAPYAKPQEQV